MAIRRAADFQDAKTGTQILCAILGADALRRHAAIRAPLLLSVHLTGSTFRVEDEDLRRRRFFLHDHFVPTGAHHPLKRVCFAAAGGVFGLYGYLAGLCRPRRRYTDAQKVDCLLSDTLLYNERYAFTRESIAGRYNYRGVYAACDGGALYPVKGMVRASLRRDHGNSRPLMLLTGSVAGRRLQRAMQAWYQLLNAYRSGRTEWDAAAAEALLGELEKQYVKRREWLRRRLQAAGVTVYVTINQYNLRDVLLIDACHALGIRTVQQMHFAQQFSNYNFSEQHPMPVITFAQEYALWSEEERLFHSRYVRFENALDENAPIALRVCGNLELPRQTALEAHRQYPAGRRITFVTAPLASADLDTPEQVAGIKEWRWAIYKGLRELAARQNVAVRIRYKPYQEQEYRAEEIPTLRQWGFEISDSTPENLLADMCESIAVISSTSSVMATAKLLGRLVYRIGNPAADYVQIDPDIHDVSVEGIRDIVLPADFKPAVAPAGAFFSAEKLLEA